MSIQTRPMLGGKVAVGLAFVVTLAPLHPNSYTPIHRGSTPYTLGTTRYNPSPRTRHAAWSTMRAVVIADGRQWPVGPQPGPNAWTQFASWDAQTSWGAVPVILSCWHDPAVAAREQARRDYLPNMEGWRIEPQIVAPGHMDDVTAHYTASAYKTGLRCAPDGGYVFQAIEGGVSHVVSVEGGKVRQMGQKFSYGLSLSPDGTRMAFHDGYQVYVGNADGTNLVHVVTDQPWNFGPTFSPDGTHILFLAGPNRWHADIWIAEADGTGPRLLASRGGYHGARAVMDYARGDFHGGSSDLPVWAGDNVIYTAEVDDAIEVMRATLGGSVTQLTHSPPGVWHAWPDVAPDGQTVAVVSNRLGARDVWIVADDGYWAVTEGGAYWGVKWRPVQN
jgi:hypothetical protein